MTEMISLATSVAACLSAIAALIVVRQNYKQRTASYRPELVLVNKTVWLKSFEETGGIPHRVDDNGNLLVSIPIVNIGFGAARDLKVSWNFQIDEVVSSVNRLAQRSLARAFFEYDNGMLSMKPDENWMLSWESQKETEIDYVLPASIQSERPDQLHLPMAYVALVCGHYHFAFKSQSLDIPDVPKLECRLTYVDVGGAKHSVDLLIVLEAVMISDDKFGAFIRSSFT